MYRLRYYVNYAALLEALQHVEHDAMMFHVLTKLIFATFYVLFGRS